MSLTPIQTCTRCVMDTTDPEIVLDRNGLCHYCIEADKQLHRYHFTEQQEKRNLEQLLAAIRRKPAGKYEVIIGLSGGVDSSYVTHLAHTLSLRALVVHFDNGWNSEKSVSNIKKMVDRCGFDFETYVINWPEFKDLQRSFFKAGVIDIEILTDHAILATMFRIAKKHKIKFILSGSNYVTEHGMPPSWVWRKQDLANIKSIQRTFGTKKLKEFPQLRSFHFQFIKAFGLGAHYFEILNSVNYSKQKAIQVLSETYDWQYYGDKHYESVFTKFYQAYVLPSKFGADKRKPHLSALIRNSEITRTQALQELSKPAYPPESLRLDKAYVLKKLGFTEEEFDRIMLEKPKSHLDYSSDEWLFDLWRKIRTPFLKKIISRFSFSPVTSQRKTLVLISASPPGMQGEEFLRDELPFLISSFDRIEFIHHFQGNISAQALHPKINLHYLPYLPAKADKLGSLLQVFSLIFWRELGDMAFKYHLMPTRTRLASLMGAIAVGKKLSNFISRNFNRPENKIYAYSFWCNFMACGLAFYKKSHPEATCVSRAHGYDVYFDRNLSNYLPLRRFIYRHLDRVCFISKKGLTYAEAKSGLYPSMKQFYLGTAPVAPSFVQNSEGPFRIISNSSLVPLKRIALIVKALSLLENQPVHWIHFGDGPLMIELKALAEKLLYSRPMIQYEFRGYVPNHQLLQFCCDHAIDAIVNVSESEGIPFSIIEAFSAGIPAIATRVGGLEEIVVHNENGFLLNPNPTPTEIKDQILAFMALDAGERQNLRNNALIKWRESFQAENNYKAFINDFL